MSLLLAAAAVDGHDRHFMRNGALYDGDTNKPITGSRLTQIQAEANRAPTDAERRAAMPTLTQQMLRNALKEAGFSDADIIAAIDAGVPDPDQNNRIKNYWYYAEFFKRDHPLVAQFAPLLGLTEAQIDDVWVAAEAFRL